MSFKTWHPENEDVLDFLRIVVEDWTKAQAIDEMVNGGYGFHPAWKNLVRYIEELDVEAIEAELAKKAGR